jgi:hypothetical protein
MIVIVGLAVLHAAPLASLIAPNCQTPNRGP